MSLWDDISWGISRVMEPVGSVVFGGLRSAVDSTDNVVSSGIETVGGALDTAVDIVKEHPIQTAAVFVATVATGGAAVAAAGPIAAAIGSTGVLGAASTGTAIGTLSGAALTNASLAALGGGAVAAGGGGIAAGTVVVGTAGAVGGAVAGTAIASQIA